MSSTSSSAFSDFIEKNKKKKIDWKEVAFMSKEEEGHYIWRPCLNVQCWHFCRDEVHYHKELIYKVNEVVKK